MHIGFRLTMDNHQGKDILGQLYQPKQKAGYKDEARQKLVLHPQPSLAAGEYVAVKTFIIFIIQ